MRSWSSSCWGVYFSWNIPRRLVRKETLNRGSWSILVFHQSGLNRRIPVMLFHQLELLYRDGFGEVSGLVDIGAAQDGGVIGEQLHRNGIEDGRHKRINLRQFYGCRGQIAKARNAFGV